MHLLIAVGYLLATAVGGQLLLLLTAATNSLISTVLTVPTFTYIFFVGVFHNNSSVFHNNSSVFHNKSSVFHNNSSVFSYFGSHCSYFAFNTRKNARKSGKEEVKYLHACCAAVCK